MGLRDRRDEAAELAAVAGARLRALRAVPDDTPAAVVGPDHVGPAGPWPDDAGLHDLRGGWVPPPAAAAPPPPVATYRAHPAATGRANTDAVTRFARLPEPVAVAVERLGVWTTAALALVLLAACALGAGVLIGRHTAPAAAVAAAPAVAFPDLAGSATRAASGGRAAGSGAGTTAAVDDGSSTGGGATGTATDGSGTQVVVDVEGRVRRPGLVTLSEGARVADAVDAAGGLRPGVHDPVLDLAARVADGQLLTISSRASVAAASTDPGAASGGVPTGTTADGDPSAPAAPIDVNTASEAELETLPGIGPVLAGQILAYVQQQGGLTAVDQLEDVPGIGPAHFAEIADLVTT